MKSADFNRNAGKIRVLQEVRPAPKKLNWDRIIYLGVLIAVAGFILFMIVSSRLYIKGEGQVLFKKLDIQLTEDIQIVNFVYHAGDSVDIGDTLFFYYPGETIRTMTSAPQTREVIVSNDNLDWIVRERLTTLKRIELANIQISECRRLIRHTGEEKKRIEHEVYLDIYPATKLDQYLQKLTELEHGIISGQEEIKFHEQYLKYLDAREEIERSNIFRKSKNDQLALHPVPVLKPYISPVKGSITQVYKEDYEVALESQTILSIHNPTNLYIKAFYDQKNIRHLSEGDVVDVKFPDGTTSMGVLQRFYFATYQLPEEFQKKYEPTTRSIAADIVPINEVELEKWKAFYKLNVKITKPLFSTS